jgi:hypothetical protein
MPATLRSIYGRRLFKAWAVAAVLYGLTASALSVAPIRRTWLDASPASVPSQQVRVVMVAKVVGRQAAIVAGPPLLLLWFGWDVWFAVVGLFGREPKESKEA